MKYGLVVNMKARNIGDDVQSYAIAKQMPSVDYVINREAMDVFKSKGNEQVAVVMAAWFLFNKGNWPPAKNIIPKFVGFHYTDRMLARHTGEAEETVFLTGLGGDFLRRCGPIGCREHYTENQLNELDIPAYFSGCITLTLPKMPKVEAEKKYICLVDVRSNVIESTVEKAVKDKGIEVRRYSHQRGAPYPDKTPWQERSDVIEDRLSIYQNAHCVVTRRLHCVLPCLAMGVPVLLITDNREGHRFMPYYDWLHVATPKEFIAGQVDYSFVNPPPNDIKHLPYRDQLIADIQEFYTDVQDPALIEKHFKPAPYTDQEMLQWRFKTLRRAFSAACVRRRHEFAEIEALQKELVEKNKIIKKLMSE